MSISIKLRNYVDKKGQQDIQVTYTFRSKKLVLTAGKVNARFWDNESSMVVNGYVLAISLNQEINSIVQKLVNAKTKIQQESRDPTVQLMKQELDRNKFAAKNSFMKTFEEYMRDTDNTQFKSKKNLYEILKIYELTYGKITFDSINIGFKDRLKKGMLDGTLCPKKKSGYTNNTTRSHVFKLINFLEWAKERGLNDNSEGITILKRIKKEITVVSKEKPWLTEEEVLKLYHLKGDKLYGIKAYESRDAFIFNCQVGLRYKNLGELKVGRIKKVREGFVVDLTTSKAKTGTTVLLNSLATEIYLKYKEGKSSNDLLFPNLHYLANMNILLQFLGERAGLTREFHQEETKGMEIITHSGPVHRFLSTHVARTTKASQYVEWCYRNETNPDLYLLMEIMGWKSIVTAERYVKKNKQRLITEQAKIIS